MQDILYNLLNQYLQQDLLSKWSGISIFCVFAESGPCVVYALCCQKKTARVLFERIYPRPPSGNTDGRFKIHSALRLPDTEIWDAWAIFKLSVVSIGVEALPYEMGRVANAYDVQWCPIKMRIFH